MDGIRIHRPQDWTDRSMIAFNAPATPKSGVAPNIVITQDKLPDLANGDVEARVKAFAARQVADMRAQLPNPVLHYQQMTAVSGRHAAEVLVSWQSGRTRLTQWVFFVGRDPVRVAIITATSAESDFADHRDGFHGMVHSMQFDG